MKSISALHKFVTGALVTYITVSGGGAFGQSPAPASSPSPAATPTTPVLRPDPDHHALYHLLFSQHTRQSQQIEDARAASPQQTAAADARIAAQYKITVAELATLNRVIASTSQKLDAIEAEARGLLRVSNNSPSAPLQAKLDVINARRYRTVVAGIAAIRKSLPPASWNNVRAFVNNEFRNTTQVLK